MVDFNKITTYPIKDRENKVNREDFAKIVNSSTSVTDFIDSLPNILAATQLKTLIVKMKEAKQQGKPIIWGLGAHVIKTGLNPLLIHLMDKGYITAIAINGAGIIHDSELALIGESSEDVEKGLADGSFGMIHETGEFVNTAIVEGDKNEEGLGYCIGKKISTQDLPNKDISLFSYTYEHKIPISVHTSIGTDIIHMHPNCDAGAIGRCSYRDFDLFCTQVSGLVDGGVYLNMGSAVMLPEVFLKAITVCRNLGYKIENFTVASFDFLRQYRVNENVVRRPSRALNCTGISITGHHEIMIPLLAAALLDE